MLRRASSYSKQNNFILNWQKKNNNNKFVREVMRSQGPLGEGDHNMPKGFLSVRLAIISEQGMKMHFIHNQIKRLQAL